MPLFYPGSYRSYKLLEEFFIYFTQEPNIKIAIKEFFEDSKQLCFPHAPVHSRGVCRLAHESLKGYFTVRTFSAASPFCPFTTSNSTLSPSANDLKPEP